MEDEVSHCCYSKSSSDANLNKISTGPVAFVDYTSSRFRLNEGDTNVNKYFHEGVKHEPHDLRK